MNTSKSKIVLFIILFISFSVSRLCGNSSFKDIIDSENWLYAYKIDINEAIYGISEKRVSINMVFFRNNIEMIYPKSISSKIFVSFRNKGECRDIVIELSWLDSLRLISVIHNSNVLNISNANSNPLGYDLFYSEHDLTIEEYFKDGTSKVVTYNIGSSLPAQGLYSNLLIILNRYNVNLGKIFDTPLFKEFNIDEEGRSMPFLNKERIKKNRRY